MGPDRYIESSKFSKKVGHSSGQKNKKNTFQTPAGKNSSRKAGAKQQEELCLIAWYSPQNKGKTQIKLQLTFLMKI